jgi:hypothetical protein
MVWAVASDGALDIPSLVFGVEFLPSGRALRDDWAYPWVGASL